MTCKLGFRASGCIVAAGLALSATAALAANGISITESQEPSVKAGMSAADVEQAIGRPARIVNYPNAPGPTWQYQVLGAPFGRTDFDVSFASDGKVLWANERIIGGSGAR